MDFYPRRGEAHRDQIYPTDSDLSGKEDDLPGLGLVERHEGIDPLGALAHRSDLHGRPRAGDRSQDVNLPAPYLHISSDDLHLMLDEKTDSYLLGSPTDLSRR